MGNTELRRIEFLESTNTYYVSTEGNLYRQMKNLPRQSQLDREGCTLFKHNGVWLNPIKGFKDPKGYLRVDIDDKTYAIHRLVGLTFIPVVEGKPQINHKDGIKTNNKVDNLEWVNNQENVIHAFEVLKRKPSYGKTGKFGETLNKVSRNNLIEFDIKDSNLSYKEIAAKHEVTVSIVKDVAKIRKVQRLSKS